MNFFVKNLFSKCEHIRIKLRIYSHLLNKSLTENFIFCVVNIIGFTTESCKFFFKKSFSRILYTNQHVTQISIHFPLQKSIFGIFERARTFSTGIIARQSIYYQNIQHSSNFYWLKKSLETCRFVDKLLRDTFYCRQTLFAGDGRFVAYKHEENRTL